MKASIIIATYNRAGYLRRCLEGVANLDADLRDVEIIIVDNNSPDETRETVEQFAAAHPDLSVRYLFEERQGASLARNLGLRNAQGEFFCFLDDDAIPHRDWLNEILSAFRDARIGCVGGPALLDFQGQPIPPWLDGDLKGLLSGYGLRYEEPTLIKAVGEFPFLCNMAMRQSVIADVGFFREDLGPSGKNLVVGEETELMQRARSAGWQILYAPDAIVDHLVAPGRLEKEYIFRMGRRLAVTHIHLTWTTRIHKAARFFLSDLWYATRMLVQFMAVVLRRKPLWFDDYMRFWMVAMRLPLRIRAHIQGIAAISAP